MKFHQFRCIPVPSYSCRADLYRSAIPEFEKFIGNHAETSTELFWHELAHCMLMTESGQIHRISQQNFGWEVDRLGFFGPKSADNECKVVALAILSEKAISGTITDGVVNNVNAMDSFIGHSSMWLPAHRQTLAYWKEEKTPRKRIEDYMEEYRPRVTEIFQTTVNYISEHCAEHV